MLSSLDVSAACSGCYSFNNLLYKEWVTNDDKDCSIIPIIHNSYTQKILKKKSYKDYYFVIIVNLICCFKNKDDDLIIIHFHVHLQAACVLDQVIQGSTHSSHCMVATFSFWYNIMIKVHQHALINLVYSYMVTKVFNIQPVHQYYLCHLLWFKKQSFTLVWKPNPPLLSLLRALLKEHLFMWSVKSDSCYNVLWLCSAQTLWSSRPCTCTSATTSIFLLGGGGRAINRQTAIFVAASPR